MMIQRRRGLEPGSGRVLVCAGLVGVAAGLITSGFRSTVQWISATRDAELAGLSSGAALVASVLFTASLVAAALWLVRRYAPEAAGSGIQQVEGAMDGSHEVRWRRVLPVKFVAGVLSLGSGMVVGREGPTVQIGAHLGAMLHELMRLPRDAAQALLAAGSAAGLAAAFNAPLSGVLFVIEEMRPRFSYRFLSVQAVIVASACADFTARVVSNQAPVFQLAAFPAPPLSTLWLFPLFGAVMGVIGIGFNYSLMSALQRLDRLSSRHRWLAGVAVGGAIGLATWAWRDVTGGGYSAIDDAVALRFASSSLALLFVLRFVATIASYGSGVPGGIFTPMLALGTLVGVTLGVGFGALSAGGPNPAVFAIVGMGALFSSTVRAPLTGIALAIELTASLDLILPLLLACATSTIVAESLGGRPIYELLLERSQSAPTATDRAAALRVGEISASPKS